MSLISTLEDGIQHEGLGDWKQDPVTKQFIHALAVELADLKDRWVTQGHLPPEGQAFTHQMQASAATIQTLLNFLT